MDRPPDWTATESLARRPRGSALSPGPSRRAETNNTSAAMAREAGTPGPGGALTAGGAPAGPGRGRGRDPPAAPAAGRRSTGPGAAPHPPRRRWRNPGRAGAGAGARGARLAPRRWLLLLAAAAAAAVLGGAGRAEGKVAEGTARLSSAATEAFLGKFSFLPYVKGRVAGTVRTEAGAWTTRTPVHSHDLSVFLFDDVAWRQYQRMTRAGSLCKERLALGSRQIKVDFTHERVVDGFVQSEVLMTLPVHPSRSRTQYWFALLADCELEEYDAGTLPPVEFSLSFLNEDSQLPADEVGMTVRLCFVLGALLAVGALAAQRVLQRLRAKKELHLLVVAAGAAWALQVLSVLGELAHLSVYSGNGKGLRWRHSWFPLDFFSEVFQGLSELLLSMILIFLGCGWTTLTVGEATEAVGALDPESLGTKRAAPDDSVLGAIHKIKESLFEDAETKRKIQVVTRYAEKGLKAMRRPAGLFTRTSFGSLFFAAVAAIQLLLERAGRAYDDEFNQFHDFEHWPGKCLVLLRVLLCAIFAAGSYLTLRSVKADRQVELWLTAVQRVGAVWFLAFPLAVFVGSLLPFYARHKFVSTASLLLQTAALGGLLLLVSSNGVFRSISTVNAKNAGSAAAGFELGRGARKLKLSTD